MGISFAKSHGQLVFDIYDDYIPFRGAKTACSLSPSEAVQVGRV
jgi:hypothetical protein